MIIKVSKNINEYAMATVNYNDKFYVIPWDEIKKQSNAEKFLLKNITCCVNKNTVFFFMYILNIGGKNNETMDWYYNTSYL